MKFRFSCKLNETGSATQCLKNTDRIKVPSAYAENSCGVHSRLPKSGILYTLLKYVTETPLKL